jgi:hypothetical protein
MYLLYMLTPRAAASCINNVALILKAQGEMELATTKFEDAAGLYAELLGMAHPSTSTVLHNLGLCYKVSAANVRMV